MTRLPSSAATSHGWLPSLVTATPQESGRELSSPWSTYKTAHPKHRRAREVVMNDNKDSGERTTHPVIRASDAERNRVEAQLQHHYMVGRLTLAEFEERAAEAHNARNREQLDALMKDLPSEAVDLRSKAETPKPRTYVVDTPLLIVLLCVAPPAALVYWLIANHAARRGGLQVRYSRCCPSRRSTQ